MAPGGQATTERVLFGSIGPAWPVPERELSMIAGRKGHLSQPKRIRFTAPAMAPVEPELLGHAYLMLIDRENPLSSTKRRP
jgi:hypothetical protein